MTLSSDSENQFRVLIIKVHIRLLDEFHLLSADIFTLSGTHTFLQVTGASDAEGCPSFTVRSGFMVPAGKLNIAAQWARRTAERTNRTVVCC